MKKDILAMSQKQRQRYHLLGLVSKEIITLSEASEKMGVSYRQAKRLKKKFEKYGAKGLIHGNCGKSPPNKLSDDIRNEIESLSKTRYFNFNDAHFTEKLNENESIKVSKSTVRSIRRSNGIKPKRKRRTKKRYGRRDRKEREGMMVLWDGSLHKWFGEDKPLCCLMAAIDDATGLILSAFFIEFEGTYGYLKLLWQMARKNGVPVSIYQDRHSALKRNDAHWTIEEQLANRQEPTQVGKALKELGITPIFALTPQAKGRVERLFGVLQDRLIAEMELSGIDNMGQGNDFLDKFFIRDYNNRFAVKPSSKIEVWRKAPKKQELEKRISFKYKAVVGNDNAVRIGGEIIDIPSRARSYSKARVDVHRLLDGSWRVYYKNKLLAKTEKVALSGPIRAIPRRK